jgi:hypothetical protein
MRGRMRPGWTWCYKHRGDGPTGAVPQETRAKQIRPFAILSGATKAELNMWGRQKNRNTERARPEGSQPLREALRNARVEAAERTGVVVDLRDAEIVRLELVNDELDPVFSELPPGIELFDRGISRGDTPRLWIDAIAHVEMGRDKRMYRFVQDSRFGRQVLAESLSSREIVDAVTRYLARRLIDRERALSGEESAAGRTTMPARRSGRVVRAFLLGIVLGIAAIFTAAWIAASLAPGP